VKGEGMIVDVGVVTEIKKTKYHCARQPEDGKELTDFNQERRARSISN
jgi:hypothetical protein